MYRQKESLLIVYEKRWKAKKMVTHMLKAIYINDAILTRFAESELNWQVH